MVLLEILIATTVVSLLSLIGITTLQIRHDLIHKLTVVLVAFAAGAMLGAAFFNLMPEALNQIGNLALTYTLLGMLIFFAIESFLHWHHHHEEKHHHVHPYTYLNLIGDGAHNFVDGILIAATYLADPALGFITTISVAAHEIPQELGDYAILIKGGFSKKKALAYNYMTSATSILGGIIGYFALESTGTIVPYIVAITAGSFIYISTADIIPEIHKEMHSKSYHKSFRHMKKMGYNLGALLLGVLVMYYMTYYFPV